MRHTRRDIVHTSMQARPWQMAGLPLIRSFQFCMLSSCHFDSYQASAGQLLAFCTRWAILFLLN
jgi:hypothetical protein